MASGLCMVAQEGATKYSGRQPGTPGKGIETVVSATIIYDNYVHTEGTKADWGYSILLEGTAKTILFDTGTNPGIFRQNFEKLKLDAAGVDEVFISHEHGDHFGGLHEFLAMNGDVKVVVPNTFSSRFIKEYASECDGVELIETPVEICENLYSSGVLGKAIPEQALVLNTANGLIVMTGCSHPGIITMLKEIKSTFNRNIYMVFGGFHLMDRSDREIVDIAGQMRDLGIVKCGATHCTGEKQIKIFREVFGKDFVEMGTGNKLVFN